MKSTLNNPFVDPGATAEDDEDGDITSRIVTGNAVNHDFAQRYEITYNVSDEAGNNAFEVIREVIIVNSAEKDYQGAYESTIQATGSAPYTYMESVTANKTKDMRVDFGKFGDYPNATSRIYGDIANNEITIPEQTIITGSNPVERTISGNGTVTMHHVTGLPIFDMQIEETVDSVTTTYSCLYEKM